MRNILLLALLASLSFAPAACAEEELKVGSLRASKILFLGNSITLHGPAPQIGWTGEWGMAASSKDKDYVHLLLDRIAAAAGGAPKVMIRNIADFEREQTDFNIAEKLKAELALEPDIVILAIGENAPTPTTDEARERFARALHDLLRQLQQHGRPAIFVRSQFWADQEKDTLLKTACAAAGGTFVDIGQLGTDPANFASSEREFQHEGVANHPGDRGMSAIADQLWKAMQEASQHKD